MFFRVTEKNFIYRTICFEIDQQMVAVAIYTVGISSTHFLVSCVLYDDDNDKKSDQFRIIDYHFVHWNVCDV